MRRHLKVIVMVKEDEEEKVIHVSPIMYVEFLSGEFYLP